MRDLEHEARTRSNTLEAQGKLPAGFTAEHYPLTTAEQHELRRLKTAMTLAEGPDDFLAIYHQGKVPARWYKRRLAELVRR